MKILVICQYYYPEPFRVNDICEEMVRRGHEVTVVTGEPNYPEGRVYKGFENHSHNDEVINGVMVHRCPIIPRKTGALYRFLNYFSYPHEAKKYINSLDGFDVVLVNQLSPVMMAEPAIKYKKQHGVPVLLYCLDLWPESLIVGGIKRGSILYYIFHWISKRIYRSIDKILVTSRLFRDYINEQFGVANSEFLPQYAEDLFEPLPFKDNTGVVDLVLAGNIGFAQSVETVVKAARKLEKEPVHFHIVGGGTDLDRLQKLAYGLNNITFYDRRPLEDMPGFYAKADAMLVTLRSDPVLSLTLPGKVQSYMAVGKPIIGAIDGETAAVIAAAKCGFCGNAEDVDGLVENVRAFIESKDKQLMGENARAYYETYFSKDKFMDKLEEELEKLCAS